MYPTSDPDIIKLPDRARTLNLWSLLMAFQQFKLQQSINQTRGIFDKYIYNPDNNDTLNDILTLDYFAQSRFIDDEDWTGSIMEISAINGYVIGRIVDGSVISLLNSNDSGGGGDSGTTYGALSNAQILAIPTPSDEETAFSTDDFIVYFFYSGSWYSTGGGVLV